MYKILIIAIIAVVAAPGVSEAACSDDAYIAFLRSYLPKVDAAAREGKKSVRKVRKSAKKAPCAATEKGYLALLQQWQERWNRAMSDDVLSPDEAAVLQALSDARPRKADGRAYAAWLQIYEKYLQSATKGVGSSIEIKERPLVINRDEDIALHAIEAMRPKVSDERAWLVWFEVYERYVRRVTESIGYRQRKGAVDDTERKLFDRLLTSRPRARSEKAYLAWLHDYVPVLQKAADRDVADFQGRLDLLLEAKACGPGAKSSEVWERVSRLRGKFAGNPAYVDRASPDCR